MTSRHAHEAPARSSAAHALFLLYLLAMGLLFLLPVPHRLEAAARTYDTLVHFGVFMGFALLFRADRRATVFWTLLVAVAVAGCVELVQWVLPFRGAQWSDFAAGVAGTVAALPLSALIRWWPRRMALLFGVLAAGPTAAAAQGSPYIQLDDPRMARFELLVDRGVIPDPTPLVRPFTEAQAVAALRALSPKATASRLRAGRGACSSSGPRPTPCTGAESSLPSASRPPPMPGGTRCIRLESTASGRSGASSFWGCSGLSWRTRSCTAKTV